MLEVKIDLVPFGDRTRTKQIGYVKIWNDGTGDRSVGNYKYRVHDEEDAFVMEGEYRGFKRLEKTVFHLMRDILNKTLID